MDLLRAARRRGALRPLPSAALRAGRTRRGVGAQPARVGAARVRRCAGRVDPRDGQPEPAAGRGDATSSGSRGRPGCSSCPRFVATRWRRTPRRSAPTCPSCDTSCASICSTSSIGHRRSATSRCRRSARTTRRRSSTRAARPGSPRARCCATAASSTMPGCGPTGSRSPTAPVGSYRCLCSTRVGACWECSGRSTDGRCSC